MATTSIGAPGVVFPDGTTQASASPGTVVTRIYASPSPWTKPASLKAVRVTVLAGGGGGGGVRGTDDNSEGGGGASGGIAYFEAPAIPGPLTVSVGQGGAGAPAPGVNGTTNGVSGGTSSFGPLVTATGGVRGGATGGAAGAFTPIPQGRGFTGTAGTGNGGNSFQNWGFGGNQAPTGVSVDGTGYGSGGSGANSPSPANPRAGGDGKTGFVIVEEFY